MDLPLAKRAKTDTETLTANEELVSGEPHSGVAVELAAQSIGVTINEIAFDDTKSSSDDTEYNDGDGDESDLASGDLELLGDIDSVDDGFAMFVEEHVNAQTPVLKLFHAFGFGMTPDALAMSDEYLWSIFTNKLRRFCNFRHRQVQLQSIDHAVELLSTAKKILVLTGAGISVSCGIPDFRSENGLYSIIAEHYPDLHDPQMMFDINYFRENPRPFFELAREIFPSNFEASPTHHFIKLLEKKGVLLRNYTQNIDTLEKAIGIQKTVHCHGSFDTASCQRCRLQVPGEAIKAQIMRKEIPMCSRCLADGDGDDDALAPIMKPDITFFGEKLPDSFDRCIEMDRSEVDLMVVIGSSLKVAPVSDLVGQLVPHSVPLLLINREPVYHYHRCFDIQLLGFCDTIIRDLCHRLSWQSDQVDPKEATFDFVEPNIHLYEGFKFNGERHERIIFGDSDASSSDASSDSESTE